MGFLVVVYGKLKKIELQARLSTQYSEITITQPFIGYRQICVNSDFPSHASGIDHGSVYYYQSCDVIWNGGASAYGDWRELLAEIAGYEPALCKQHSGGRRQKLSYWAGAHRVESGPLMELMRFSDCEGVIGPRVSAKLADDFRGLDGKAKAILDADHYLFYTEWRQAFETAGEGGAVIFEG